MAEEEVIHVHWHVDREKDPCDYMIICEEPGHEDLRVALSSGEVTERVAKARLMEMMYQMGAEKGIPARRLRFKVNGIEE